MSSDIVLKYADSNNMHVLFHEEVTAWLPEKKKSTKYVLITERILAFFDTKAKTIDQSFFWVNADTLNWKTEKNKPIELSFLINEFDAVDVSFLPKKTKSEKVVGIICDLLPRILPESQNEKLKLFRFITESSPITGYSIYSRMLGLYESKAGDIPNNFEQLFEKRTMISNPILNTELLKVSNIRLPEFYDSIFEILPFLPYVDTLMLFDKSAFTKLKEYKSKNIYQYIHHLYIQCSNERFNTFIEDFPSLQNDINGFSFEGTSFKESHIETFFNSIQNKRITSIGFHSQSVDMKILTSPKFTDNISKISNQLKFLSFDNFGDFSFDQLASQISFITVLSLVKCNLDISATFQQIIDLEFKNLSELDLSDNKPVEKFKIRGNLPPSLSKIVVKNITWGKSTNLIRLIFCILVGMNSILKLNLSNSKLDDDWDTVFKALVDIDTSQFSLDPVTAIGWNGNPISEQFFAFLSECKNLSSLSLAGCFNVDSDNSLYQAFINYLNQAHNLQTLILKGEQDKRIRNNIYGILESLSKLNSLQKLDISDNEIGDDGLIGNKTDTLLTFLKKKPKMTVVFDGSSPSSLNTYLELYKQAPNESLLCYPIHDSFPYEESDKKYIDEIRSLSQKMFITPPVNIKWKTDSKQKLITQVTKPESNPLDKPYFVYYDHDIDKDLRLPTFVPISYAPVPVQPIEKKKPNENENHEKNEKGKKHDKNENDKKHDKGKKNKKHDKDYDYDYEYEETKRKKETKGKNHNKDRKKTKNDKRKYKDYSDESDDKKPRRNHSPIKSGKKGKDDKVLNYLEKKDGQNPQKSSKLTKNEEKKQLSKMQTVMPSKKLTNQTKKKKSEFEFFNSQSDSDHSRQPPKKMDLTDDSDNNNPYIKEPKPKNLKQKRGVGEPVIQRPPPQLDSSDDDNVNEPPFSKKSKIEKNFGLSDEDEDNDEIVEPKPPQWDFPLYFVPDPNDCEQIVWGVKGKVLVEDLVAYMDKEGNLFFFFFFFFLVVFI